MVCHKGRREVRTWYVIKAGGGEDMVCHKGRREVRTWYVIRAGGR